MSILQTQIRTGIRRTTAVLPVAIPNLMPANLSQYFKVINRGGRDSARLVHIAPNIYKNFFDSLLYRILSPVSFNFTPE